MLLRSLGKVAAMKHYEVLISDKALADMESIYNYIANTLLEHGIAVKQYNRIADAILTLEQMPDRIRLIDSEPERSKGLRPLLVDNFTVLFVIRAKKALLQRVRILLAVWLRERSY